MNKISKAHLAVGLVVYLVVLAMFDATYSYSVYWIDEPVMILIGSVVYFFMLSVVLFLYSKQVSSQSNISLKRMSQLVALSSLIKASIALFCNNGINITETPAWVSIAIFFFYLSKNMK